MDCLWEASFPAKCIAVLATRLILVLAIMIGSVVFCLLQFAASPFYFIGFSLLISMVFVYLDMSLRVCVTHDATVKSNIKTANNSTSGRNQRSLQNADILAQVLHISGPLAGCALIIFSLCIGLQARDYAYVRQPIAANISVSEVANLTQYDLFSFYDGQVLTNYSTQIKVDTKDTNYLTVAPISTDGSIANIAAWAETYSSSSDLSPDWQLALRQARRTFGESGPPEEMHKAIKTAKEQFMLNTTAAADKTILIWEDLTAVLKKEKHYFLQLAIAAFIVVPSLAFVIPLTIIVLVLLHRDDPAPDDELAPISIETQSEDQRSS